MGNYSQFDFLTAKLPEVAGPILEIGSKDYGNTQGFREFYKNNRYVGVDMEAGKNVDVVLDLTNGIGNLTPGSFKLIIVCSVMEHSPRPWLMAENIQKLLSPTGILYSAHPWVWRYHKYPDDYFRFSHAGIKSMFSEIGHWAPAYYVTNIDTDFHRITGETGGTDDQLAVFDQNKRKYLPYLLTLMLGSRSKQTIDRLRLHPAEKA